MICIGQDPAQCLSEDQFVDAITMAPSTIEDNLHASKPGWFVPIITGNPRGIEPWSERLVHVPHEAFVYIVPSLFGIIQTQRNDRLCKSGYIWSFQNEGNIAEGVDVINELGKELVKLHGSGIFSKLRLWPNFTGVVGGRKWEGWWYVLGTGYRRQRS